jgi:hypothetical protein
VQVKFNGQLTEVKGDGSRPELLKFQYEAVVVVRETGS